MRALHLNPISFTCFFGENLRFVFEENPHFLEKHKGHKCTEHGGAYRVNGGTRVLVESVLRKWLVDILCMRKGGVRGVRVPCVVVRGESEGVRIVFTICTPASVFRLLGTSRA